ncbi:hypothetical protein CAEBREN_20412 [Caenorhabditis brenneri]|uniref:Uncharacterized protein n=1 Tax=Caenorhabditis brenneri TaxID=135651 RepID=G0MXE0_CAEBE|nr:hypothetical protein CAEBREN_20412 [Caenorhabditis brenneri]
MMVVNVNRWSRRRYYRENLDEFRYNADCAVGAFGEAVRKLTYYSEQYNKKFFDIPLRCAKSLHQMCLQVRDGLYAERPRFRDLERLADEIRVEQMTCFNQIAKIANHTLSPRGFIAEGLYYTYKEWKKITGTHSVPEFRILESDHRYALLNFMEVFAIPPVKVFCLHSVFADITSTEFVDYDELETPQDRTVIPFQPGSTSTSPDASDDEDDSEDIGEEEEFEYLPLESGDFKEFEAMLEIDEATESDSFSARMNIMSHL